MSRLLDRLWDPLGPQGKAASLLAPWLRAGALLFRLGVEMRDLAYRLPLIESEHAPLPVISVGGIEVGGVGKTPLVAELMRLALRSGRRPAVLSRGYGARVSTVGSRSAVRQVEPDHPQAVDRFGDEPVWLARRAQELGGEGVWLARRRIAAARRAAGAGADLLILDDGLQHRRLARQLEVVSLAGSAPLANGRLLPAGPLREPAGRALARADCVVLSALDAERAGTTRARLRGLVSESTPIFSWRGVPSLVALAGDPPAQGEPVRLVAGIAHPERLVGALGALGHEVARAHFFGDHHRFRPREIARLRREDPSLPWIVSEKDWLRLEPCLAQAQDRTPGGGARPLRLSLLHQGLAWNEDEAETWWRERLAGLRTVEG